MSSLHYRKKKQFSCHIYSKYRTDFLNKSFVVYPKYGKNCFYKIFLSIHAAWPVLLPYFTSPRCKSSCVHTGHSEEIHQRDLKMRLLQKLTF
jgi:hypothetical protein